MGSLFGGAQTVNTGQQTAQAANQSFANSSVNAANQFAQGLGSEASSLAGVYAQPGWYGAAGFEAENPYSLYQLPNLNPTQTQAIGQLGQAGTSGQGLVNQGAQYYPQAGGYIGQGTQLMGQAGQGITPQDINAFQNPFTANVTANLQDIFGQQNTQNLLGSTAAAGGTGSERSAVGQALLAQRQGLTAGNIYADLYQRSLQAAEQQKAQQLAAGQGLTGAGQSIGSLGLQGVGAGVGAENAALQAGNVQFNRDVAAQALQRNYYTQRYQAPMQQAAGIAQIMYPMIGLGQTAAQTGTSQTGQVGLGTGATTFPAPSPLGGLAGLGLAGAALFAARGGRINKKHKFDLGGAVSDIGTQGSDGLMQPQGMEDAGDTQTAADSSQLDPIQQQQSNPAQQQAQNSPQNSLQQQSPQNPYPVPRFMGGQQQQGLQNRNRYALMSSLIANQARRQQLPAPQIKWPQMMRQEGGRVPLPSRRPLISLGPKNEETELDANFKLSPYWGLSKRGNPYFNFGADKKANVYGDIRDPGIQSPMHNATEMMLPSSGEAPGLYADGGAVDDEDKIGGEAAPLGGMPPMAQAALSDDDDDDVGGEAAPLGGAPRPAAQVNQVLSPYDTGVNPSVGVPGPNAGGMSPGKLALLQAGLGMMAASGQRDRHGLPMSPMAAIGQGGMQGVNTYQAQQALAQRERMAQATLDLKGAQLRALEEHRKALEGRPFVAGKDEWGEPIYATRAPKGELLDPIKRTPLGQVAQPATEDETKQRGGDVAKGIANYNLPPLSPFRMQTPAGRKLMDMVLKENPEYDARFYNESNRAKTAFGTGTQGDTVRRFNTFIAHSHTLERALEALKNKDYPLLNAIRLQWKRQTGSELPTNFEAIRDIYGNEAVAATVGTRNALGDRQEVRHQIATSNSPEQTLGIIEQHRELAGGQLRSLKQQYENSTRSKDFEDKLLPESKHALSRVKSYAGTPEAEVTTKEMEREKADAQQWIKDNPNADPKKIERIKKHYGLE